MQNSPELLEKYGLRFEGSTKDQKLEDFLNKVNVYEENSRKDLLLDVALLHFLPLGTCFLITDVPKFKTAFNLSDRWLEFNASLLSALPLMQYRDLTKAHFRLILSFVDVFFSRGNNTDILEKYSPSLKLKNLYSNNEQKNRVDAINEVKSQLVALDSDLLSTDLTAFKQDLLNLVIAKHDETKNEVLAILNN